MIGVRRTGRLSVRPIFWPRRCPRVTVGCGSCISKGDPPCKVLDAKSIPSQTGPDGRDWTGKWAPIFSPRHREWPSEHSQPDSNPGGPAYSTTPPCHARSEFPVFGEYAQSPAAPRKARINGPRGHGGQPHPGQSHLGSVICNSILAWNAETALTPSVPNR